MVTKKESKYGIEYLNELGQYHREDGPAIEFSDGTKYWYIKGQFHREDGPAREFPDGSKFWYLNGEYYTEQEHQQEVIKIKLERLKSYGN
jgi:hypothetical protein